MRLILASTSPRRRDLLEEHGYRFEVHPPVVDEIMPADLTVGEITLFNARQKAAAVAGLLPEEVEALVIGVDTLVALDGEPLGKPADLPQAHAMLRRLSGRIHEVHSGLSIIGGEVERATVEVTRVRFRPLEDDEIATYLARINPLDKAGSYAAQDDGGIIEAIEGSKSNVIGLPMEALSKMLRLFPGWCAPTA